MVCGKIRYSFSEFNDRVNRLANGLIQMGMTKGERIALLLRNCHYHLEVNGAAAKSGLVLVPLNFWLTGREISQVMESSKARVLFVGNEYLDSIRPFIPLWKDLRSIVCIGNTPAGMIDYEEFLISYPSHEPGISVTEADLLYLLYTSGTTSLPKGVMLTHGNVMANLYSILLEYEIKPDSISLITLPLFTTSAININFIPHLYVGSTCVILKKFSPEGFFSSVETERITHTQLVPTMLLRILQYDDLERFDIRSLRTIGYGSAPTPIHILREALEFFGPIFVQNYGLTEVTSMATCLRKEEHLLKSSPEITNRLSSCGRETFGVDVRVVREDGSDANLEEIGEVIIRGPTVMEGYWEMPELTSSSIKRGWFYSGDLATMDEEGYIYLQDRKKDMIISGGMNIYSGEIEGVLQGHPYVLEAAVIGVPDEVWGEAVKALVVLKPGFQATEEEIIQYCGEYLARYKIPKSVDFLKSLPRNPTGKVKKKELRQKYLGMAQGESD